MADAEIVLNQRFILLGRYRVEAKVYKVEKNKKFPDGIKARYVLIDLEERVPRLLVDNHEPFGFHMHTALPGDKNVRVGMDTNQFQEAYEEFLKEVDRILKDES